MTRYTKHLFLAFAVLASVCTIGRSEEPQWPKRNLQFEIQAPPVQPRHPRTPPAVTHMAVVIIGCKLPVSNLNLDVSSDSSNGDPSQLLRTPAGQSMSEKQRELLAAKKYMAEHRPFRGPDMGDYEQHTLYAVSEDDARKMAEALVELCDIKGRARLEETRKELDNYRNFIPEGEKKLAELDASIKAAEAKCAELRKTVSYRNLDDALQDVVELDKALRTLQVEIAGIEAKVSAIKKLKKESTEKLMERSQGRPAGTVRPGPEFELCDRMLVTEDIELAGLLARKNTIEGHRKNAQQYCTLEHRRLDDEKTKESLSKKINGHRGAMRRCEKTLADPPDFMKPLTVLRNAAQIYPVSPAASSAPTPAVPMPMPVPGQRR